MTLKQAIDILVGSLPGRQKEVISQRFGIGGAPAKTLAVLGEKYGITRERVRQIEAAGLRTLTKEARANKEISCIYEKSVAHLEHLGGIRRHDFLVDDLKFVIRDEGISSSCVELLYAIFKNPKFSAESNGFYEFWYLSDKSLKDMKMFVGKVATFLKGKKEAILEKKKFDEVFFDIVKTHKMGEFVALNYILNSKKFSVNPFGDFGLAEWPEILPKTVRDKSYLVLKKNRTPLHFTEIAKEINRINFDSKKAHPQTVHNELIKDSRFVLVGRGLYSLSEFGLEPGTTREVLLRVLKKNGPLKLDKIIHLVSQQRVLKHNTILLNLHNKKYFKKRPDGLYHLA